MFRSNYEISSVLPVVDDISSLPIHPNRNGDQQSNVFGGTFHIGLFDIGSPKDCMYSYCCPSCAIATTRYRLDRSSSCVNCCLLNPSLLRWLVRSAYHIRGSPFEDCVYGTCCYVCVINQALQTTKKRGSPHGSVGPVHNTEPFLEYAEKDEEYCSHCFSACCFSVCSMALISDVSLKMPVLFSLCCSNYCIMRNILRYQWHLAGDDWRDDCCVPISVGATGFIPGVCCFFAWPYFIWDSMAMWKEAGRRGYIGPYLSLPITTNPLASAD